MHGVAVLDVQPDIANKILDMPSRQSGCCLTASALPMLCQRLPAQCPNNTSPTVNCPRGRKAQLLLELLPANGMKLGCIGLYYRCGNANRGSQKGVWNGKSSHQRAADALQLTTQLLNHPVDGPGLLKRYINIIANDALQNKMSW